MQIDLDKMLEHIKNCHKWFTDKQKDLDARGVSDSAFNRYTFESAQEVRERVEYYRSRLKELEIMKEKYNKYIQMDI